LWIAELASHCDLIWRKKSVPRMGLAWGMVKSGESHAKTNQKNPAGRVLRSTDSARRYRRAKRSGPRRRRLHRRAEQSTAAGQPLVLPHRPRDAAQVLVPRRARPEGSPRGAAPSDRPIIRGLGGGAGIDANTDRERG